MKFWRLVLMVGVVSVSCTSGCAHFGSERFSCQVRMANKSSQPIFFVVMDPDGAATSFGWFGVGGKGGTASGCSLPLRRNLILQWEEEEVTRRKAIDLSIYESKMHEIKSMGFYYMGNGQWKVEAQRGTRSDAEVVVP